MSPLRCSLLALAAAAAAGTVSAAPAAQPSAALSAPPPAWSAARVTDADLDGLSGGQAVAVINEQQLKAMNSGNSVTATDVTNGPVNLSAGAFSGFSGLGNFVINTGNNNNLQGTMSVNIMLTPSP